MPTFAALDPVGMVLLPHPSATFAALVPVEAVLLQYHVPVTAFAALVVPVAQQSDNDDDGGSGASYEQMMTSRC